MATALSESVGLRGAAKRARARIEKPLVSGSPTPRNVARVLGLPMRGVRRYIFSSAQNNTAVESATWTNLLALVAHYGAQFRVARYTYNKGGFQAQEVKSGTHRADDHKYAWYAPEIEPYVSDEALELAPDLLWCGQSNIIPTAKKPLSEFEDYGGTRSLIVPHAKVQMKSVSTMPDKPAKLMFTTGTVTQINYLQRKAGQLAEFHHVYGALLVEVQPDGQWWVRQLNADKSGTIYDLDRMASGGVVSSRHRVGAVNWGDIHELEMAQPARQAAFDTGGILDTLRPHKQFSHDTLSFVSQNHHDFKNSHRQYEKYCEGITGVRAEVRSCAEFLQRISRDWCETLVVDSNHDSALQKWLNTADFRADPENSEYFLALELRKRQAIRQREPINMAEYALRLEGCPDQVKFLTGEQGYVFRGVQFALHGHNGTNGGKGSPENLSKIGEKLNTGHTHSAGIYNGVYTAGTWSWLRLSYTSGPGSWSWSCIVTYDNGKRAIVTLRSDGGWRARGAAEATYSANIMGGGFYI